MADFIVLYTETFPFLRLYTVKYVVCIMIYFSEICVNEVRKGCCKEENKIYHIDFTINKNFLNQMFDN